MNRNEIRELITDLEKNYPVNNWYYNGYLVWPVLRIKLYMYLTSLDGPKVVSHRKRHTGRILKIYLSLVSFIDYHFLNESFSNVYLGDSTHCGNINGVIYNRYFDILMDGDINPLYFSKSSSKKKVYKPERHFLFSNLFFGYKVVRRLFRFSRKQVPYIQIISNFLKKKGIESVGFEQEAISFVRDVDLSVKLSNKLLTKIKPKKIWVLCYYSADVLGLLIAAHKQSITTIDMQHGGQGKNHLAYSSWSKVPTRGYEALPDHFYTWDIQSAEEINYWAKNTQKHIATHFGNPWVEGWKHGKFEQVAFDWPEKLILYTLQPIEDPLEDYLLESIQRTKKNWNWWLRLHPRQKKQKDLIVSQLRHHNLLEYVNIDDATALPLPEILKHTQVHITKFSGCAIEAYQFGVRTILIDEIGKDVYRTYINNGDLMEVYLGKKTSEFLKVLACE